MKRGLLKILYIAMVFILISPIVFPTINYATNVENIQVDETNEELENETIKEKIKEDDEKQISDKNSDEEEIETKEEKEE